MNDPAHSRHSVRWLKLTLKGNMNTIVSLPEALGTLRGCQSFIKKKEEMLPTVMKMKGKLELALAMRQKKRDVERDALDIENMKPLVTIRGGEIVTEKPNNLEEEEESVGAQEMLEEDDLDDELDDELDEDEKLYQEAYENEELEEGIEEGEEEDGDVEEDEN